MKKIIIYLLFLFVTTFAQTAIKPQLLIMDFDLTDVKQSDFSKIDEIFITELQNTERFDVMSVHDRSSILQQNGISPSTICNDTDCFVNVGKIVQAERVIGAAIKKDKENFELTVKMIDVENSKVMMKSSVDFNNPDKSMLDYELKKIAREMAGLTDWQLPTGGAVDTEIKGKGTLYLNSNPSQASIYIDGKDTSLKTPATVKDLQAGAHFIRIEKESFSASIPIYLQADEFKKIGLQLDEIKPSLKILTKPAEAEVFIDNEDHDVSPLLASRLDAGEHLIRIRKQGYVDYISTVTVSGEFINDLIIDLQKWSSFSVLSEPADADVYIDDLYLDKSPVNDKLITPGKHLITIKKKGFKSYYQYINVEPGKSTLVKSKLESISQPEKKVETSSAAPAPERKTQTVDSQRSKQQDMPLTDNATDSIQSVSPKTTKGAVLRSTLVPGLGQHYSGYNKRSIIYPALELLMIGGIAWANSQYNTTIDDYDVIKIDYLNSVSDEQINLNRDLMLSTFDDIESYENQRNYFIIAAVGVWIVNILDAAFFEPKPESNTSMGIMNNSEPQICLSLNKEYAQIGFSLHF